MPDKIRLLPDIVASQIAAGEVVNRPSSVVKEMMENSIDAGASCIIVNFREGGGDLIQIVDDGCGMSPTDARMAFERHATSKIAESNDIYSLRTFGFRGEALASIAAVSQVELRTRQAGDSIGTSTLIDGGVFSNQEPVMCEVGSQFFVRNLFYNVPARRRFMDRVTTSANQIKADFKRVALCNPDIHFELYSNDSPIFNLPPASLASRIVDVVGRSIKNSLLEISAKTSIVSLHGYIGKPSAAKKTNNDQYLFVNGRFFRSPYFTKALLRGYDKLIPAGSTPSYFIYFTIDPDRIDVNVHPQKTEVKFEDNDDVWQIIVAAVRETLAKSGTVPMMDFDDSSPIDIPVIDPSREVRAPRSFSGGGYNPFDEGYIDPKAPDPNVDFTGFDVPYTGLETQQSAPKRKSELKDGAYEVMASSFGDVSTPAASGFNFADFESIPSAANDVQAEAVVEIEHDISSQASLYEDFVSSDYEFVESSAQPQQQEIVREVEVRAVTLLGGGYAFMVVDGAPLIMDVGRAKERVLYDHFAALIGGAPAVSQQLLFPERLILTMDEYHLMQEREMDFAVIGFDVDFVGDGSVDVKGIPPEIRRDEIDTIIYKLLEIVATPESVESERRHTIARTMARSGAAAATIHGLNTEQVEQLAREIFTSGNTSHSPSGKPIIWRISQSEIADHLK